MMENAIHNLLHQLSEDVDSLWRYDQYKKDAKDVCPACYSLWDQMRKMDEDRAKLLLAELESHMKKGEVKI